MSGRGARPTDTVARVSASLAACGEWLAQDEEVPADQLAGLLVQLAALQHAVSARLLLGLLQRAAVAHTTDRLLTVTEAAERLACTTDWLYRQRLPFAVRNGRQLRYSEAGLVRYIGQRAGRERTSLSGGTER